MKFILSWLSHAICNVDVHLEWIYFEVLLFFKLKLKNVNFFTYSDTNGSPNVTLLLNLFMIAICFVVNTADKY